MDFLYFDSQFCVLICTRCQYALVPGTIAAHLGSLHKDDVAGAERKECVAFWKNKPIQPAQIIQRLDLPIDTQPILNLALYHDGISCRLCPERPYVCSQRSGQMQRHLKAVHGWKGGQKVGRPTKVNASLALQEKGKDERKEEVTALSLVTIAPIFYQTFHRSNFLRYFRVAPPPKTNTSPQLQPQPATLEDQVEQQLLKKLDAAAATTSLVLQPPAEPSPWLQTTEWVRYLEGHNLRAAAELIALPHPLESEPDLVALLDSLDRVVEQARNSILQGKVNAFDQQRINSFLRSGSRSSKASDRPLAYKLQAGTYTKYKSTWKQLLCFVYRLIHLQQQPSLHCLLTAEQSAALDQVVQAACVYVRERESLAFQSALDLACLQFCIALLDHRLMGALYDSAIVGFLAVLGIDKAREGFQEAITYTTHLSAVVKIAQLLVLQRAVVAAETGETEYPADMLEVMQDRFMVYGSRSPINWVQKLRVYGKKIRDSTTSLGYMVWSDDGQELEYKGLQLRMASLKRFVRRQVDQAQDQLQQLLLIHAEEAREDVVPVLRLQDIRDDPSLSRPGQSFLTDSRNSALQGYDRWLLNRVLKHSWLQDEFFVDVRQARWKTLAAEDYLGQVDAFLERILLIAHITSGQPARGTELLSLQYCNAAHGRQRNIFIENGLVAFVTFCYKGYSITNSTKIIHRYLPQEVSELLVYYLWLVLPFCTQLKLLALNSKELASPYLWAAKEPVAAIAPAGANRAKKLPHWDSSWLSRVLQYEFQLCLNTTANITLWRHAAIAISRRHLGRAKFKRDYSSEPTPTWVSEQTGHTALVAGNVYARGIEEAPGHVASARAEFRALSRSWHTFLGFGMFLSVLPPNGFKQVQEEQREEVEEYKLAGYLKGGFDIEAEVQRRVKLELVKLNCSHSQLPKRKALDEIPPNQVAKRGRVSKQD